MGFGPYFSRMQLSRRASQGSSERPELFGPTERLTVGGLVRAGVAVSNPPPCSPALLPKFYKSKSVGCVYLCAFEK